MITTLLATKLHRPAPPVRRVQRQHLVRRLDEGLVSGRRLTLVSAPAGFGKTSCVSEWLDAVSLPVAWLSLDAGDDDPGRFFAYLLAALQSVDPNLGRELAGMLQAGQLPPIANLTATLLGDILGVRRKFILVLDDLHVIRSSAIFDTIGRLIAGQPDEMHIVLVTREDPQLPLARLRAYNQMTEIRAADLRFSSSEAGMLLNELLELSLSVEDIAALKDRTEGWVVGLQLAGLSMRGHPDPSHFIANLTGSHRFILSYLTEEVLSRQVADVQAFLLKTSILERLSGDLCDAVTGRPDSSALLERLFEANLFLVPLDDERRWYRYHHLFAHLLAARLQQTSSAGDIRGLHCVAAGWFAEHDLTDEAIRHALAGHDYDRAVSLVEQVARTMIFAGRLNALRNWLGALPESSISANPRLKIYRAWIDLLQGRADPSPQAMQEKEEMLKALPPSPENDRLQVELMLVLCRYLPMLGDTTWAIHLAEDALGRLESDVAACARINFALAVAYSLAEDAAKAAAAFRECLRLARAAGDYGLAAEATALMAQGCHYDGQLHEAARQYRTVADMSAAVMPATIAGTTGPGGAGQIEPFYPAGLGYIGLASIYLEWNDLEAAERYLERGMELCVRGSLDEIYRGYYIRSRLCQARGDLKGALAEIELLDQTFPREDDPLKIIRLVMILRAMGDIAGVSRCAQPWLKMLGSATSPATAAGPDWPTGRAEGPAVRHGFASHRPSPDAGPDWPIGRAEGRRPEPGGAPVPTRPPRVVLEVIQTLAARVFLAQGDFDRAMQILDELRATAEPGERLGLLIEVHLLRALALYRQKMRGAALEAFESALDLAEPEGYVMLFLEEGPDVLQLLAEAQAQPAAPERRKIYARKLLDAFTGNIRPAPALQPEPQARPADAGLAEPLSARELELLRLIGEGCTNQEIAGRMVITLHTVKKHSSNIFGKLGVTNRTQAVARARQLGLLP